MIIGAKYKLLKKISEGQFGVICEAENIYTEERVAIKMEPIATKTPSLQNEARIYHYLTHTEGIARLKLFGTNEKYRYIVMDLLGVSLHKVIDKLKVVGLKDIMNIGTQMILRIRQLHEKQLLHRDIKPDNFVFDQDGETLFLVDFGFCKKYEYNTNVLPKYTNSFIGTPNFISINVHNKMEPSRRDDLESCIYVLVYLYFGKVPWHGLATPNDIYVQKQEIADKKSTPKFISALLTYVRGLEFDEEPDYVFMLDAIDAEYKSHRFKKIKTFELFSNRDKLET